MNKSKVSAVAFIGFSSLVIFLAVYLVGQRQNIGKKAATSSGIAVVSLSTPRTTYYTDEIIPVQVKLRTGDTLATAAFIGAFQFRIQYPYTGATPELELVTDSGAALGPTDRPFYPNTSLPNLSDWLMPLNRYSLDSANSKVNLEIGGANTSITGFQTATDVALGAFFLKVKRVPAGNSISLSFDPTESIVNTKINPTDVLKTPVVYSLTIRNTVSFNFGVKLQGITVAGKTKTFDIRFRQGATNTPFETSLISGANGVFSTTTPINISSLNLGTYEILIKDKNAVGTQNRANHLRKNMGSVAIVAGVNTAPSTWTTDPARALKVGDVNDDNVIDINDITSILNRYTAISVPVLDEFRNVDVNSDGIINILDVSMGLMNYTALSVLGDN